MRLTHLLSYAFVITLLFAFPEPAQAQAVKVLARKAAERVGITFGKKALGEGVEAMARRIEHLALSHGDDAIRAVERVGPRAFHVVEKAGTHGTLAARMIARHGDEGVAFVCKPRSLALVARHGDECGTVLAKHAGIADAVVEHGGAAGIKALAAVGGQSGRRLTMMAESGELAAIGRTPELLDVVAKFGDAGMTFIYRHKKTLAVAAVLAAFLREPELFISGAKELAVATAETVTEHVVAPLAQIPVKAADRAIEGTNWTVVVLVLLALFVAAGLAAYWSWWHSKRVIPQVSLPSCPPATAPDAANREGRS